MLNILGEANQAWDAEGLMRAERVKRADGESKALTSILEARLQTVQRLKLSGKESDICGFPAGLLLANLGNNASLELFLLEFPQLRDTMVDRFVSTDDCEFEFAVLALGCGFKPPSQVALGFFKKQDCLVRMRQDPTLPFRLTGSTKSSNPHHVLRKLKEERWSNPKYLSLPGPERDAYYWDITRRASAAVRKKRSIRQIHTSGV